MAKQKTIITDKSGYTYNRETGYTLNEKGEIVGSDIPTTKSDKMIKLELQATVALSKGDFAQQEKIRAKINALVIAESPFLYSTPEYCYSYVLYKLRKVADYSQEGMAFSMGIPLSTYIKIENRILKPSLHNLIMARVTFTLTALELAELYTAIEEFVIRRGSFVVIPEESNYNIAENTTPIDLYESKMLKEEYNHIDTKFREIYLKGRKRQMEKEQKQKEEDDQFLKAVEEYEKLGWEDKMDIEQNQYADSIIASEERQQKDEQLIKALQSFHGTKYNYSL